MRGMGLPVHFLLRRVGPIKGCAGLSLTLVVGTNFRGPDR